MVVTSGSQTDRYKLYSYISTRWHKSFEQQREREPGMKCKYKQNKQTKKKIYIGRRLLCPVSSSLLFSGGALVLSIIFLRLSCPLRKQARDFCSSSRASWHRKKQNRGSKSVLRLVRPQQMRQMGKSDCSKSHGSSVSSRETNLYPPTR